MSIAKRTAAYHGVKNLGILLNVSNDVHSNVSEICDFEIYIESRLAFDSHINHMMVKTYVMARQHLSTLRTKKYETLALAYRYYVDHMREYGCNVRIFYKKRNITRIERAQRYYTLTALKQCDVKYLNYAEKFSFLQLDTAKAHDMCMVCKVVNSCVSIRFENYFVPNCSITRGHNRKLCKRMFGSKNRRFFP